MPTKNPENMSRDELLLLIVALRNENEKVKEQRNTYRAVYQKQFDIGVSAKVPLKAKKGKTPGMLSFRELEQWIFYAERLQETMPPNLFMSKSQICRAAYRSGLFSLCLQFEKAYEDGDEHSGYKYPESLERVKLLKQHMYETTQEIWKLNLDITHQNFEYEREIARKAKNPISAINKLNELESAHIELFKPSYETNLDNIKIMDTALKIANKKV